MMYRVNTRARAGDRYDRKGRVGSVAWTPRKDAARAAKQKPSFLLPLLLGYVDAKGYQILYCEGSSDLSHPPSHQRGPACHRTHVECSFSTAKTGFTKGRPG